ncbi:MAG: hypothetical protein AB7Q17_03495 [Phycisphaerae bacterium]
MIRIHRVRTSLVAFIASLACSAGAVAQPYSIDWYTIDGGGAMNTTGGAFSLSGTIGQHDAGGPMTGGNFSLTGGFWVVSSTLVPGDMNCDGVVNNFDIDPFVLALTDAAAYAAAYPGCNVSNADINGDGLVNNFDIDFFVNCLTSGSGCP